MSDNKLVAAILTASLASDRRTDADTVAKEWKKIHEIVAAQADDALDDAKDELDQARQHMRKAMEVLAAVTATQSQAVVDRFDN